MSEWRAGIAGPERTMTILWPGRVPGFTAAADPDPGRVGGCLEELGRSEARVLARINLLANWFLLFRPLEGESPIGLSVYEI